MQFSSRLIDEAVDEIAKLPGIGKKTALRLVLHLLKERKEETESLSEAITNLRQNIRYCKTCHMVSDSEECSCLSMRKDTTVICIVEDIPDVIAIENTSQYNGLYHVLGGIISPINGIGPDDLNISSLEQRVNDRNNEINEIILALSPTMEGDTTAFYISKKLKKSGVKISTIARGIPIGGEIEYADEITLGRSILTRTNYTQNNL